MSKHLSQYEAAAMQQKRSRLSETEDAISNAQSLIGRTAQLIDVAAANVIEKNGNLIVRMDGKEATVSVVKDGPDSHVVVNGHRVYDHDAAVEHIAKILFA